MQAEVCWVWTARSKGVFPGVIYGLALGRQPVARPCKRLEHTSITGNQAAWQHELRGSVALKVFGTCQSDPNTRVNP